MNARLWMLAPALILSLGGTLLAQNGKGDPVEDSLPAGAVGRLGTLRLRQAAQTLTFSLHGRLLVSAGFVTRLFDGRSGKLVRELNTQSNYAGFSPDSKTLFTSPYGFNPTVKIWDMSNGAELRQFSVAGGVSFFPSWSADGKVMIASSFKNGVGYTVTLWDMATGNELRSFVNPGDDRGGSQVALTPDGKSFAFHGRYNVYLFNATTGKETARFASPSGNLGRTLETHTFAFSADGTKLACLDSGGIALWNITGERLHRLTADTGNAVTVAMSPDAQFLAAGTSDGGIFIFDAQAGKLLHTLREKNSTLPMYLLAFSPDGKTLASQQHLVPLVRLWDVRTGQDLCPFAAPTTSIASVALTPDGSTLIASDGEGKLWHWSRKDAKMFHRFPGVQPHAGGQLTILADGKSLFLDNGSAHVWDLKAALENGSQPANPRGVAGARYFPELSPDGKSIVVAYPGGVKRVEGNKFPMPGPRFPVLPLPPNPGQPGAPRLPPPPPPPPPPRPINIYWTMIGLWDVRADKQINSFQVDAENLTQLALDPKSKKLAGIGNILEANGIQAMIFVWDLTTGKELHRIRLHENDTRKIVFSSDGRTLISGPHYSPTSKRCSLCRWDMDKGILQTKVECVPQFGYSPNIALAGDRFAAFATGRTITLIDVATGKEVGQFAGHIDAVSCMSFSADARFLASGSNDTTALIWELPWGRHSP